jgi:hypothetical protein
MAVLHQVRKNVDFDIIGHRIDGLDQNHFLLLVPNVNLRVVLSQVLLNVPIQRQRK